MEVINDLVGFDGLKIYQNTDWFLFSLDSVLLPNFVTLNKNIQTILDLGTGNAPIPLILSTKTKAKIVGVEIQKDCYNLACKSVLHNNLQNQIEILNIDMKELKNIYSGDSIDVITCNPPYFKYLESSNINENEHKVIARHEKMVTLDEIISLSSYLLKNNGVLALVHRTERLAEIIELFSKYGFETKKLRLVYPKQNTESNIVLIEARKNGGVGLKVLPPLYAHYEDGNYTEEVLEMFK